ncbi:MAG: methyl-accepting chemotaxis protein, partial [Pseudomonadota bacterium]
MKIIGLGVYAALAVILVTSCTYMSSNILDSHEKNAARKMFMVTLVTIKNIDLEVKEIFLNKESGSISPELEADLKKNFEFFEGDGIAKLIDAGLGQKDASEVEESIGAYKKLVVTDLYTAVLNHAEEATFKELDRKINVEATKMELFSKKAASNTHELQQAAEVLVVSSLHIIEVAIAMVCFLSIGCFLYVTSFIKSAVVVPFKNVSEEMTLSVLSASTQMSATATDLDKVTSSTKTKVEQGANDMQTLSRSMQEVSGATEELGASIEEIKRQINFATNVSNTAVDEVRHMKGDIEELNNLSQGISEFTDLINKVADSTNLLALNATIEAARAGEAGDAVALRDVQQPPGSIYG